MFHMEFYESSESNVFQDVSILQLDGSIRFFLGFLGILLASNLKLDKLYDIYRYTRYTIIALVSQKAGHR